MSALFVSPPVPATVCGERCLSPDVSGLSRVPSPSGRRERRSRRLRAKSHLSLAQNRGQFNGWFEFGQRSEMPCFVSNREFVSSVRQRTGNRSNRRELAAWLRPYFFMALSRFWLNSSAKMAVFGAGEMRGSVYAPSGRPKRAKMRRCRSVGAVRRSNSASGCEDQQTRFLHSVARFRRRH
jgi:hypothetical protein